MSTRKPLPYATLLAQQRERLESARKRQNANPTNATQREIEQLEGDIAKLERFAKEESRG